MNVQKIPVLRPVGIMLAVLHVPVVMVIHCKTSKSTVFLRSNISSILKQYATEKKKKTQM